MAYEYEWNVRLGDTDASGLVYTAVLFDRLTRATSELMREIGYPHEVATTEGVNFPTASAAADFLEPIRIGETVTVSLEPDIGTTSVTFDSTGHRDGVRVFEGSLTMVFVDTATFEPTPVPDDVRRELERVAGDQSG